MTSSKNTAKKILSVLVLGLTLACLAYAEDATAPSAPNVVAPAQPVTAQTTTNTTVAATSGTAAPQVQPSMMGMALPFIIMLTIMYFLMIRPQQKRMKEHQSLLSTLKAGDEVVTSSGIIGKVANLNDKVVTLEVSNNVQMRFLKSQVNQIIKGNIQDIRA